MYANIVAAASFWSQLVEIDLQFQRDVIARGCPRCGGPLHVADHPRKPRGVPDEFASGWSKRCNVSPQPTPWVRRPRRTVRFCAHERCGTCSC